MKVRSMSLGLLLCLSATAAFAQVRDDAEIRVSGYSFSANGAEKPAESLSSWRTTTGTTKSALFSVVGCGHVAARWDSAGSAFQNGSVAGWRVDITPTRVVDHVITFRLRWTRALDTTAKAVAPPGEDVELTLKPGESRPIDTVALPPAPASGPGGRPCAAKAASLRVSVAFPEWDNRLIGADVWLVERLSDRTERSQLLSLRGIPHRPMPFYFDRMGDVDLFGELVADLDGGTVHVALEAVRAQFEAPPRADRTGYIAAGWDRATVRLKPGEVVEVPLRQLEERFGPYAKGNFALRIRARQIR